MTMTDAQLALPLQDARAARGTASAANAEEARQRANPARHAAIAPAVAPTHTPAPREAGEAGMQAAQAKAEREVSDFTVSAAVHMLAELDDGYPRTGEQLVDAVKRAGIAPTNDKAFGAPISMLARLGLIRRVGFAMRRKGHGAPGASLWQRTDRPHPTP